MYEYELLDAKSDLRLLILEMGGTSDPIKCRLVRARFARRPFYEALSYTWGSAGQKKQIWLHGQRTDVRSNLWCALFKLRRSDKHRLLWVDALCINQHSVNERNHQVALMKDIFTQAAEVIVWLGPEADDSDLAMDFLNDASSRYAGPSTLDVPTHKALRRLCNRDYWKRMWVLQEVSLAKHLTVHCGTKSVDWQAFVKLYQEQELHGEFERTSASRLIEIRLDGPTNKQFRLLDLVAKFSENVCLDLRDKVFALLALATDCRYKADYSKSLFEIYQDIMNIYFPLYYSSSCQLYAPYSTLDAIKCSQFLQGVLGGPFDIPLEEVRLHPLYREVRTKPTRQLITPMQPTEDGSEAPQDHDSEELMLHVEFPKLLALEGEVRSVVDSLGCELEDTRLPLPGFILQMEELPNGEDSRELQGNIVSVRNAFYTVTRELSLPEALKQMPSHQLYDWISLLPSEFRTPYRLQTFTSKGRSEYWRGIGTLDIKPGDQIWEFAGLVYVAIVRWMQGQWNVVGKAIFVLDDMTIVTPERRQAWDENKGKLLISNNKPVSLELDIIGLQKLTC